MKRALALLVLAPSSASAEPQLHVVAGAAIPLDSDDDTSGKLDLAVKGLWRFEVGAVGLGVHWTPLFGGGADGPRDTHRFRILAEGQTELSDDGHLAWILTVGIGVQVIRVDHGILDRSSTTSRTTPNAEVGVCMAFTGWRFPPLICVALNVGLSTGDIDAVPQFGLRF